MTLLLGAETVEGENFAASAERAYATPVSALASGTVTELGWYLPASVAATEGTLMILADSGGKPATSVLASAAMPAFVAKTWSVVSGLLVPVTSGTTYWIAAYFKGGTGKAEKGVKTGLGTFQTTAKPTLAEALAGGWSQQAGTAFFNAYGNGTVGGTAGNVVGMLV